MLDLLGRRQEAVAAYKKASSQGLGMRHDQYGLMLSGDYIKQRLQTPFKRIENKDED